MISILNTGNIKPSSVGESTKQALEATASGNSSGATFDSGNYFNQKFNDVFHEVDLYLDNSGDFKNPRRFFINPAAVLSLVINDAVNDWVVDGYMTFMYLPEEAEREQAKTGQRSNTSTGLEAAAIENAKTLQDYEFRGDGFDLLRVMVIPKTDPGKDGQGLDISRNDTKWMLSYVFSIYDVEDVNNIPTVQGFVSPYMKCLKVKFHDVRHQMLRTVNIEYSTSIPKDQSLVPNVNSEMAKTQGVLYTGDIMRDILNEVLAKPENGGCEEFKIDGTPDKWDKGKGELFYTSPASYSAQDDLDYVYNHHISIKNMEGAPDGVEFQDMCMLHTERSSVFGKVEELHLTPLQDFFEKAGSESAGEIYKETFYVTSATEEENVTNTKKVPQGGDGKSVNFQSFKYGQIMSYSFVDMSAAINSEMFRTAPVYSVDIGKREFNVEFKGNNISSVKKMFAKTYISKLFANSKGVEEELFLPVIHKNKESLNLFPTWSTNGNNSIVRQKNGLHQLLYTGIFQNACIKFTTYGATLRESGTFIGIERTVGSPDTDYSNKLYGQWFVISVDHVFEGGGYTNVIHAVKLHRFKPRKANFENLLQV